MADNIRSRRDALPWVVAATVSLFYLSLHSAFYNFDGVACAIAVETGDLIHLVHGNHLAYGVAAFAFDRLWRLFGYGGAAILTLQVLDSLLGAASAGVFCALLLDLNISRRLAALAALGLSVSFAFWFWSLEAQVYPLGALFLVLTAREAFRPEPRPGRLGFWHGLALLGHLGHACFAPAALYLLRSVGSGARFQRDAARCAASAALVLLSAYAAAALFVVRPETAGQWRIWLLGSAALSSDRSFLWHGGYSWEGLKTWLAMGPRLFAGRWLLSSCALLAAAAGALTGERRAKAALIWLAGYAALFLSWEPFTIVYRITDLFALWLLIALAASAARWRRFALAAWVAAATVYNWKAEIAPRADPANNAAYQEALWVGQNTPENAWIAATTIDQVYIPYFAHRRPLNLRYFTGRPEVLRARIAELEKAGEPVYLTDIALSAGGWESFFADYRLEEIRRRGAQALYRVKNGKPGGKR